MHRFRTYINYITLIFRLFSNIWISPTSNWAVLRFKISIISYRRQLIHANSTTYKMYKSGSWDRQQMAVRITFGVFDKSHVASRRNAFRLHQTFIGLCKFVFIPELCRTRDYFPTTTRRLCGQAGPMFPKGGAFRVMSLRCVFSCVMSLENFTGANFTVKYIF